MQSVNRASVFPFVEIGLLCPHINRHHLLPKKEGRQSLAEVHMENIEQYKMLSKV
jgi:hypothetical protein